MTGAVGRTRRTASLVYKTGWYLVALSIGIVGLPNVGKSTLFTALTKKGGLAANYPFATIDPNVGIVDVPDDRLQALADIVHPGRIVPATVEFVDIAGLVKGANEGEGLGNQFLANIRETDAICEVVRYFKDPNVMREVGRTGEFVDPAADADTIMTELILADIQTLEKQIPKLEKEARRDKELAPKLEVAKRLVAWLNEGNRAAAMEMTDGKILTGKTSELLGCSSALLLNALKYLGNIPDEVQLISPSVIEPVQNLKVNVLGNKNPRLHIDELLVALSICAVTDANAKKAVRQLQKLRGCEAHTTVILSEADEDSFRRLGVRLTSEPKYEKKKLLH